MVISHIMNPPLDEERSFFLLVLAQDSVILLVLADYCLIRTGTSILTVAFLDTQALPHIDLMAAGPQSFQLYHFSHLPHLDHHFGDQNRVNRLSNSVQDQYAGGILLTAIRRHGEWLRAHGDALFIIQTVKTIIRVQEIQRKDIPYEDMVATGGQLRVSRWEEGQARTGNSLTIALTVLSGCLETIPIARGIFSMQHFIWRSYKPRAKRTESFHLGKKGYSYQSYKKKEQDKLLRLQSKEAETLTTKHLAHRSLGLIRIVFDPHRWCMDLELLNLSYAKASKRNQLTIEFGDDVVVKEKNCLCKSRMRPGSSPMSSPGPAAFCAWFRPSWVAGDVDISPESQPPLGGMYGMEMKGGPNGNDKESPTLEAGKDSRSSVPFSCFKVRWYGEVEVEDEYIVKEIGEKMQQELEVAKCKRSFDGKKQRRLAD
ncbi:hypothetical protein EDD85DRAFT_798925 [Armillaria nabsnona]|nr:hypothetical protein EDD85DRAFT_798925 [Armillaria nabsnona]